MGTTEREEGVLPEDGRVEGSYGRTGQQGSDEVCLGYFLWPLCDANILFTHCPPGGVKGLKVLVYTSTNRKRK